MGCDYFIYVYLEIEHTSGISKHELARIHGYYSELDCGIYDSDDEENEHYDNSNEYKQLYEDMVKLSLTPRKPIILYENSSFKSSHFEKKYTPIIQKIIQTKEIADLNHFEEIITIIKKEKRNDI